MRIFKSHPILKLVNSYILDSPQPTNLSYLWNFGSLLAFCIIMQIVTVVILAMHYNPSVLEAFNSVEHIMRDVNNGWLIRYFHSNTASAFFFMEYLHIGRGLFYGFYRSPRSLVCTIGTVIYILIISAILGTVLFILFKVFSSAIPDISINVPGFPPLFFPGIDQSIDEVLGLLVMSDWLHVWLLLWLLRKFIGYQYSLSIRPVFSRDSNGNIWRGIYDENDKKGLLLQILWSNMPGHGSLIPKKFIHNNEEYVGLFRSYYLGQNTHITNIPDRITDNYNVSPNGYWIVIAFLPPNRACWLALRSIIDIKIYNLDLEILPTPLNIHRVQIYGLIIDIIPKDNV